MLPCVPKDHTVPTLDYRSSVGVGPTAQRGVLLHHSVRVGSCVTVTVPRRTVLHRISVLLEPLKLQSVWGRHGQMQKLQLALLALVTSFSVYMSVCMYV